MTARSIRYFPQTKLVRDIIFKLGLKHKAVRGSRRRPHLPVPPSQINAA